MSFKLEKAWITPRFFYGWPPVFKDAPTSVVRVLFVMLASVFLAGVLAESYHALVLLTGWAFWVAAASVHTLVGGGVLWYNRRFLMERVLPRLPLYIGLLPAFILGVTVAAALLTRWIWPEASSVTVPVMVVDWTPLFWVIWIPPAEEVVFRLGFGEGFKKQLGAFWGAYYSALFFAFMHSFPTFDRMWSWSVGLTLGPLLLGLCCEYLWHKYRRLWLIVGMHAACNATGLIFSCLDARWLDWIGLFYQ